MQPMFTALITRDVKQRYDLEHGSFKIKVDKLNYVDPAYVKS